MSPLCIVLEIMGYKVWVGTQLLDNILSGINRYLVSISEIHTYVIFLKKQNRKWFLTDF